MLDDDRVAGGEHLPGEPVAGAEHGADDFGRQVVDSAHACAAVALEEADDTGVGVQQLDGAADDARRTGC